MRKIVKFLFFIIIILKFIPLAQCRTIYIYSEGIALIKGNIESSRREAIQKAITNGVKKILKKNISKEKLKKIINEGLIGYEIIKEKIEGNFIREKLKILFNDSFFNVSSVTIPYIIIGGFIFKDFEYKLSKNVTTSIIEILSNLNLIVLSLNLDENITYDDFLDIVLKKKKDYVFVCKLNFKKFKHLSSINKDFGRLSAELIIFDRDLNLIKKKEIVKDLIIRDEGDLIDNIKNEIKDFVSSNTTNFKNENSESIEVKLMLIPKNFSEIEKFVDILNQYGIKFKWDEISKKGIIFNLMNINKSKILELFKSEGFKGKYKIVYQQE